MPEGTTNEERVNGESRINGESSCDDEKISSSKPVTLSDPAISNDDNDKKEEEKTNSKETTESTVPEEISYNVKVIASGVEPFELQVSSLELVQEIHQVLMDREETCHRTCFSLRLNGTTLDNFAELKAIEGLKDGIEIRVVEEPYSVREARNHVKHVHELLRSVEFTDAYLGREQMSLSFLNAVTGGSLMEKSGPHKSDTSSDLHPPDHLLPGVRNLPLGPLHPFHKDGKPPQCFRSLAYSQWNPPPSNRRLHGDLVYLAVHTLEDKRLHVTACPRGFFLNQSSDDEFNPRPDGHPYLSHSLVDLLRQVSPGFKRHLECLLRRRANKHPLERVPTPYQVHSWLSPVLEHGVDAIRKEEAFCSKMAYEENLPGQTREWNEELQATRELPQSRLHERLLRDRAVFKSNSDFVAAATRAAVSIVNGNIMPINPGESHNQQMFIWNNMFFSLGFDVKDHYKDFGGDAAAHAATVSDLNGVRAYSSLDQTGLYTLGTCVVDYRGYRVTAQTIIPGILEKEQEQSVVYGSIDFGKSVVTHDKYKELLSQASKHLRIRPHDVLNEAGEQKELYSSVECKGIIGNDNRHYILDLLRTFPPDVNFMPGLVSVEKIHPDLVKMGFPCSHPHKLCTLRQELIEAFVETRYVLFLRLAAYHLQQIKAKQAEKGDNETTGEVAAVEAGAPTPVTVNDTLDASVLNESRQEDKEKEEKELEEAKKIVEEVLETKDTEDITREIIKKAAKAVGSRSDTHFDINFNPDVYQDHVKFPEPESEELERDRTLVREACEFLVLVHIPRFVQDCLEQNLTPQDGQTFAEAMHQRGINIRYLGKVVELLARYPSLDYLHTLAVGELVTRGVKHYFSTFLQPVDPMNIATAVAHLLNCYLSSCPNPHPGITAEEVLKLNKKKNKRKVGKHQKENPESSQWELETPASIWSKIVMEIKDYYHTDLECSDIDSLCERFSLSRVTLLRNLCRSVGIQIALRDFSFDSKHRQTFTDDDIMNLFPVVKHLQPQATDAYAFFSSGQSKISAGQLHEGHELVSEALNLLNNVYGPLHADIAACNRLLARLSYVMGAHTAALMFQHRAAIISERVHGIDSPHTTAEYSHLALYCFACGQLTNALQLMYRARYIALLCHGEVHPEIPVIDTNIGLMLHASELYDKSIVFLEHALKMNKKFFGPRSLKAAMSQHLLARAHSCRGDFRLALNFEKECFSIYKERLGVDNERTKESNDCLRHLTQQAVVLAKKMNELTKGDSRGQVQLSPIQIQTPSMANILETLNLVNGIFFIQLTGADLERFRSELSGDKIDEGGLTITDVTESEVVQVANES